MIEKMNDFSFDVKDEEVKAAVRNLVETKVPLNDTKEVKKFLFGSVELTTLQTIDSKRSVKAFVERVNDFEREYPEMPHVATIVTYPNFAKTVSETLKVDGVIVTCVSGSFPSSQALLEVRTAETSFAVRDGAKNIDIVMNVGEFLDGNFDVVANEISEQKKVCGSVPMKVILETGDLPSAEAIKKASILSMLAGADYVKTSTGKEKVSATPEAVYVMCLAIKEFYEKTGKMCGLKPAGGINTVQDALTYYTIVKEVLGEKWLTNELFRLGTSRLSNTLLSESIGKEVKFF